MGIVIDAVIVSILLINIFLGYKKGLVKVIISILAFFISIIAALLLYKPISAAIINDTQIDDKIRETIINNYTVESEDENKENKTAIQSYILDEIEQKTDEARIQATENVADTIAIKAVQILTAISIFIIVRIIAILLRLLSGIIEKIPVVGQMNQVGGIIYGVLRGLVIIYIILLILFLVASINGKGMIQNAIDTSYITKFIFENNIVKPINL